MADSTTRPCSADLKPGARVRHVSGDIVTLDRRKVPGDGGYATPFHPGWWLRDGHGGLADFVIDNEDSDWTVVEP